MALLGVDSPSTLPWKLATSSQMADRPASPTPPQEKQRERRERVVTLPIGAYGTFVRRAATKPAEITP